jgi:N-acetylated-alpha-linked acidic dipeptidase
MLLALALGASFDGKPLLGFSAASSTSQLAIERRIDALVDPMDQDTWMRKLTARPHHVGSAGGLDNANYLLALYKSWGYDAKIETFDALFPTPLERSIELNGWHASLAEPTIPEDPSGAASKEALPLFNVYSIDGDVKAPLVYVNYGLPNDYVTLEQQGIDVKGKIVITRYGGGWRGTKPKVAAEHGAIGCIIYSDPRDDGYGQGDVYPKGPWRNGDSGQRGSVADIPIFPGDPLSPGIGSVTGAKRLPLAEATTLTKIPVMPIGYSDAKPLLEDLQGPVAPSAWRGALPIAYHIGPSAHPVHLKLKFNWGTAQVRDVIAKLPGKDLPNQWIIRGNHYDAWVYGANDPISGQVAMLSEAKAIGQLTKEGWHPRRTIVFCSWDGEEPGLLGSTEWVETHAEELSEKAVAYINSDSNSRGFVGVGGSHTLEPFANQVMDAVTDPETHRSVLERLRSKEIVEATADKRERLRKEDLKIGALGTGSDFSPFLQHLGIASLDIGYGGESEGSQYHSTYDSYQWFIRFCDPGFVYGRTLSQTGARFVTRLADADDAPFDFTSFAKTVDGYVTELVFLAKTMKTETQESNRLIKEGIYALVNDPTKHLKAPKLEDEVPNVDLAPLQAASKNLLAAAEKYKTVSPNPALAIEGERALLGPGLPGRPWYRHTIYAPGLYTGYGVKTLPGVREGIEQRHWKEAEEQAKIVAEAIDRLTRLLENSDSMAPKSALY